VTRYRLTIEYNGEPFVGWQRQSEGLSIQQVLEDAVFKFCGERATVYGAGRTDAGVHALAQVAHLDLEKEASAFRLGEAVNYHVKPHPIAILDCVEAAPDFHARFSAIERRYRYRIVNRRAPLTLDKGRAWRVTAPLDAAAMHAAAQVLVGKHDFTSFRATDCQAESPVKTLDQLDVARYGEDVEVTARARSFLHHQVRNMVGTLKLAGEGKWGARDMKQALEARDRAAAGATAPPDGLYLVGVKYASGPA
jgi:tRNA pseudouridine38-40 synthase